MNIKALVLITTLLTNPLAAECLNCIKPHSEKQINGQKAEWIEKKCMALQKHIRGKKCPGCNCPRASHTKRNDEYAYHNGKKLKSQNIGSVDLGTLIPERAG